MKTFKQFLEETIQVREAWIPPLAKRLRGGTESPLSAARKRGTDVEVVRSSVKRYAEPINRPSLDVDFHKDEKTGKVSVKSKKHPIEVSYTPMGANTFIQNTEKTGILKDRTGAGREMQRIKSEVSKATKPGTIIVSQPVGKRRESLNTRTQGMGSTNKKGVQAGVSRHRSPRQIARGAKPLDPIKYSGTFIDPNH